MTSGRRYRSSGLSADHNIAAWATIVKAAAERPAARLFEVAGLDRHKVVRHDVFLDGLVNGLGGGRVDGLLEAGIPGEVAVQVQMLDQFACESRVAGTIERHLG